MIPWILIQARMGSHRFPGKVLAPLGGQPLIAHVVQRCLMAAPAMVITSVSEANAPLTAYLDKAGYPQWDTPVPEDNVLARYAVAAHWIPDYGIEGKKGDDWTIVRITADCPAISPKIIRQTLDAFRPEMGYLFSHWLWDLPKGYEVEVFTASLLLQADWEATDPYDREHVTPWMRRYVGDRPARYTDVNYSVDTVEDLHRLEGLWPLPY